MIFTAGMSPAWQQIMQFDSLQIGEVNRARSVEWCASGKVLNVAIAAQNLGAKTSLLAPIGGLTGEAIRKEIEQLGIRTDWLELASATRVCTTILEADGATTELVENARPVENTTLEDFRDRFRTQSQVADVTVLTGSIPGNAPDDYYAQLIRDLPARFILDFRGPGLLQCLQFSPMLVKPNREELETTFGRPIRSDVDLVTSMRQLNTQGAEWVVVSDGSKSLLATNKDGQTFKLTPPRIDVVNPIGCGDCLAAGIACAIGNDQDIIDAIRFGMGAAAQNATQRLPARVDEHTARQFANQVHTERFLA